MKREFVKYDSKKCFRINIITTIIFFVILIISTLFLNVISQIITKVFNSGKYNNGFADLAIIISLMFLVLLILFIYSLIIPWIIDLYNKLIDCLKLFIGITLSNILISVIIFNATTFILASVYLLSVIIGIALSFTTRYLLIKAKRVDR